MRIIGLYIYDSPFKSVNKVLKKGWYPLGYYPEPEEGTEYVIPKRGETIAHLYDLHKTPHIEVSCIVGKNGCGKSTLLEVLYRVINNFALWVLSDKAKNNHGRHLNSAKGVYADLYYEQGNKVHKIVCKDTEIKFFVENANHILTEYILPKETARLDIFNEFFYTISTNYSLYSLNEDEYVEALEDNRTIDGDWVDGMFHKNDGYLAPVVVTPFRDHGIVDIENENNLAQQRVMAIALLDYAQGNKSFLQGYIPTGVVYNFNGTYRSQREKNYSENWKHLFNHQPKETVSSIVAKFSDKWKAILKADKYKVSDDVKDMCIYYLAYKSFKICMKYDDYWNMFGTDSLLEHNKKRLVENPDGNGWINSNNDKFDSVVQALSNEKNKSHISLKVRQCLKFAEGGIYTNKFDFVELKNIKDKAGYAIENFDDAVRALPPAFMNPQLRICKTDANGEAIKGTEMFMKRMSSGERPMLYTCSYVLYHLKNLQSVVKSDNCHPYNYVNLIFDEAELYFHPEYQRKFLDMLLKYIEGCNLDSEKILGINIVIVTHSPFILSDMLVQNTLYLTENGPRVLDKQTFGGNYYDMLCNSFMFTDSAMGEVARQRIKEWITEKNRKQEVDTREMTNLIGDPLLLNYLTSRIYSEHVQD